MNQIDHNDLLSIVSQKIMRYKEKNDGILKEGVIEEILDRELVQEIYDVDREQVLAELEMKFSTLIGAATSLHSNDKRDKPDAPWVTQWCNENKLRWVFWARYRQYLLQHGWAGPVVSRLDLTTSEILDSMMQPDAQEKWDQRGLVVGHIQSGKTSNYIALICKAVDAGYKVIVVLAGAHNNLRTQTQIRLEEGFLGYSTIDEDFNKKEIVGVGKLAPVKPIPDTITTRGDNGDFKTAVAQNFAINPGGSPLLFVVKKNTTVLRNLHEWVKGAAKAQDQKHIQKVPLLMIDDESDYASVDTRMQDFEDGTPDPEHDPTAINRWIRLILGSFEQSVYIGYTATPFANIFIHENAETHAEGEDLFPRSFIFTLPLPSNYIGPVQMFGLDNETDSGLPIFRTVSDHAYSLSLREKEGWMPPLPKKNHCPRYMGETRIPPSLKKAIYSFILSTAARKARGQTSDHNTMLVHVTRSISLQSIVKTQVEHEYLNIRERIIYGDGDRESLMDELKLFWEDDYKPTSQSMNIADCNTIQWPDVRKKLPDAVNSIVIREINGFSSDILEYSKRSMAGQPFDVIAIGGDKLSRGLTLEGLSVSYFLRHSKMYDTLMQMGRWFGYRPGYLDLCRIYTTDELQIWFRHISKASEELRQDFNRMVVSGCTPRQFGHRVMNHPQMMVTSPTKMRYTEKRKTSFDGCSAETILFLLNKQVVENNFMALQKLISNMDLDVTSGGCLKEKNRFKWCQVRPERIISFLDAYRGHPAVTKIRTDYIRRYIIKQNSRKMLLDWTVYIPQGIGNGFEMSPGYTVRLIQRDWFNMPDKIESDTPFRVRRLASPSDEFEDLDKLEYKIALDNTIEMWKNEDETTRKAKYPKIPNGPSIRFARSPEKGMLCIYPVISDKCSDIVFPLIGLFFSFPRDENAEPIEYTVNEVYRRQEEEGFWDE